jgi:hypothetical protein
MSRFTNVLIVSPFSDGKTWYLRSDFGYEVGDEGSADFIDVPKGFATDFASVPRPLWWIFPKWDIYGNAAVIHDFLYYDQKRSRAGADKVFLEAMGVLDVPAWRKYTLYYAVSWFGFLAWRANARRKARGISKFAEEPVKSVEKPKFKPHRPNS